MAILLKAIYIFSAVPHQSCNDILHKDRKINPKVYMKHKRPLIANAILSKKSNASGIPTPDYTTEPE
jgi:hypothetical protein